MLCSDAILVSKCLQQRAFWSKTTRKTHSTLAEVSSEAEVLYFLCLTFVPKFLIFKVTFMYFVPSKVYSFT